MASCFSTILGVLTYVSMWSVAQKVAYWHKQGIKFLLTYVASWQKQDENVLMCGILTKKA